MLYGGLCKALLFHDLEYYHTDFFGFLEMSRSLLEHGELLRDNVYGYHSAIHNYYLMLAFSPLTLSFGAYGLILGLVLLHAAAVWRVAFAPTLDLAGRVAVLGACLGPIAYAVFDNPVFGFHAELCYPPLCALLALDLREGRTRRAILIATLVVLVKEDGAVLCASVLLAFFAPRLWDVRKASPEVRRPVVTAAALSLLATVAAFVAGMALLWAVGRTLPQPQEMASVRVLDAVQRFGYAIVGHGILRDNLAWGLTGYAAVAILVLLPLARRFLRGLLLLLVSSPPLLIVLVVSAGAYRFRYMLWPLRLAAFLALATACLTLAPQRPGSRVRRALPTVLVLLVLSGSAQLLALQRAEGYSVLARLDAPALWRAEGTRAANVAGDELRFLRCLGGALPRSLPVSAFGDLHPVFHRQSVVFEARREYAREPPRLRVVPAETDAAQLEPGFCRGPRVGGLEVRAECGLVPLAESCLQAPRRPAS